MVSNSVELSEELFHFESKMIVSLLDLIEGEEGERNTVVV
jgi:hypothetical protein